MGASIKHEVIRARIWVGRTINWISNDFLRERENFHCFYSIGVKSSVVINDILNLLDPGAYEIFSTTEGFTDLGKLNLHLWWVHFRLKPIYTTAPAAFKNDLRFKSGQNQLENHHIALLIKICDTLCRFSVFCRINFNKFWWRFYPS